jgi:hypothetical protein
MARSAISAPILTSTSNSRIAAAESVTLDIAVEARNLAEKIEEEEKQDRRKFVDVIKKAIGRRKFAKMTMKDKVKNLTGWNSMGGRELAHKNSQAALVQAADTSRRSSLPDPEEFGADSHFGSLTRSFNSALEKLDFQPLRSKSSESAFGKLDLQPLQSRSSISAFDALELQSIQPKISTSAFNQPQPQPQPPQLNHQPITIRRPGEAPAAAGEMPKTPRPGFAQLANVQQLQFTQAGYVAAGAAEGRPGGVDPLGMHAATTAMAQGGEAAEKVEEAVNGEVKEEAKGEVKEEEVKGASEEEKKRWGGVWEGKVMGEEEDDEK